jgi:uncharacterized protein YprB with RNaseH-like and TPR domain
VSLKQKLQLYKKELHEVQQASRQAVSAAAPAAKTGSFEHDDQERQAILRAAHDLDTRLREFDDQFVLVHTQRLDAEAPIGPHAPAELDACVQAWQTVDHPLSAKGLEASDLLFFDTETTGLSSGTGQMIFLIGMARVSGRKVELKQYFLPGPGHEAAFYQAFLTDCRSLKNLVTFNGKAFDWPRVKTRHRFVRERVPRLPAFGHFDLLYASRRLWRKRLESVGLQNVERDVLSMKRTEDVPGKMAPFLYFQFLKHPDAGLVSGILKHNREDVLSLITLYIHLSLKLLGRSPCDSGERYEIARWDQQLGNNARATAMFESLARGESPQARPAKRHLAELYKKRRSYGRALSLLQSLIREDDHPDEGLLIEAAKIMEHQFKDYIGAVDYTKRAIEAARQQAMTGGEADEKYGEKITGFLKRMDRLDQKLLREMNR